MRIKRPDARRALAKACASNARPFRARAIPPDAPAALSERANRCAQSAHRALGDDGTRAPAEARAERRPPTCRGNRRASAPSAKPVAHPRGCRPHQRSRAGCRHQRGHHAAAVVAARVFTAVAGDNYLGRAVRRDSCRRARWSHRADRALLDGSGRHPLRWPIGRRRLGPPREGHAVMRTPRTPNESRSNNKARRPGSRILDRHDRV